MNQDIKVGSIVAKQGAWMRKYQVAFISKAEEAPWGGMQVRVILRPLGNFWADGRPDQPAKKAKDREIAVHIFNDVTPLSIPYYCVDKGFTLKRFEEQYEESAMETHPVWEDWVQKNVHDDKWAELAHALGMPHDEPTQEMQEIMDRVDNKVFGQTISSQT